MAGCGGGTDEPGDPTGPSTGTVAGRVLDDALNPVADVQVRVLGTDLVATSDASGAYRIEDVPVGPVRLVASAAGYSTQTQSGTVALGQALEVEFHLTSAPARIANHNTVRFDGRIACGLPQGLGCGSVSEEDLPRHRFEVGSGLAGIVFEVEWTPQVQGTSTTLRVDATASTASACGEVIGSAQGPSVLRLQLDEGFPIAGGHQCALVYPAEDAPVADQEYTLYVTLFYFGPPSPEFTAIP
jgi:hypothetical protein